MPLDALMEHAELAQKNVMRMQRDQVQSMMIALGSLFDSTVAKKYFAEARKVIGGEVDKKNQYTRDLGTLRKLCGAIGMGRKSNGG